MLRLALVTLFLPSYLIVASCFGCLLAWMTGSPRPLYDLSRIGIRLAAATAGIRCQREGPQVDFRNSVIVANHQSHLDAPLLFVTLDFNMKAVAKKEIFALPFFGRVIRMAGFVSVDRSDPDQSKRAINQAAQMLKQGECFLVFPEGTRSRNGELGEFKKGGFVAAIEAGSRVIPVAVIGARTLMPRGRLRVLPGTIRFRVLEPLDARGYTLDDRDRLARDARARIAAALAEETTAA